MHRRALQRGQPAAGRPLVDPAADHSRPCGPRRSLLKLALGRTFAATRRLLLCTNGSPPADRPGAPALRESSTLVEARKSAALRRERERAERVIPLRRE